MSNPPEEPNPIAGRTNYAVGGSTDVNAKTAQGIGALNLALQGLQSTMAKMQQQAATFNSSMGGMFKGIAAGASTATSAIGNVSSSLGNIGQAMFGSANEKGWVKDFMMFPTRFMRGAITENRQLALSASAAMGPQAFGAGVGTQGMMTNLTGLMASTRLPGGILGGSPNDMLNLINIASRVGAGVDWRNPGGTGNAPRAAGFLRGVAEAQRINPGETVGNLAAQVGGQAGNVQAQQQAAFLTGGAFSMIGIGNRQKSVSEWAEGILKWLSNLRAGGDKGKPFKYSELMSQNFPGSNIDAWLSANGISDDMKQMFWSYAMAKANAGPGATADQIFQKNAAVNESVAYQRLQATSAQTRTGFQLAGTMAGAYANKEQANKWMNELLGHMMNQVLPSAMSSGALSYMQYLPDQIEEIIMQLAERTNLGTLGAGVVGWGSQFPSMLGANGPTGDMGDVGDVGGFSSLGGTTTAGLHPDVRKRVNAMMRANPRLQVNSGLRDLGTQRRLKRQGVGRVSGRPSAHTRGLAADLGPRSEYPWIMANAGKFGLRNGASQGEPWHVQLGDVADVGQLDIPGLISQGQGVEDVMKMSMGESLSTMLSGIFKGIFAGAGAIGASPEKQIQGIGGSVSSLLKGLMGVFTQGEVDPAKLKFRDVYEQLVDAANKAPAGLPTGTTGGGSGNWWSSILDKIRGQLTGQPDGSTTTGPPGASHGPGGAKSLDAFFRQVLTKMQAPVTTNNLDKLGGVAKFEGGGGSYNPFNYVMGPGSNFNSVGVKNYPDWDTGVEWTRKLLAENSRTKVMYSNVMSDASYGSWQTAVEGFYHGWGGHSIPIRQDRADAYLQHNVPGAGDLMDSYAAAPVPMTTARSAPIVFQNTFHITGGQGGQGGIDMRRTVQVLADQLEDEMRRRVARTN